MIPIHLSFQAFESYAEPQEVDFTLLSEDGLFLINGETGAGKTAILDAMTYALYEKTSGGDRGEVRCLLREAEELPTQVSFTFSKGGKIYRFTRALIPKSRKGKTTLSAEQNALFWDPESADFQPFESNPTKARVEARAREILGLTLEQFRQVVILPQGQFERFLTSDSGEKEKVLSTLFHADRFTRISEQLLTSAREEQNRLELEEEKRKALLSGNGFDSLEPLQNRLLEMDRELAVLREDLDRERAALEQDKKQADQEKERERVLRELAQTEEQFARLLSLKEKMDRQREQIRMAKQCQDALPLLERFQSAQAQLREREAAYLSAKEEGKKLESQKIALQKSMEELESARKEQSNQEEEAAILVNLRPVYRQWEDAQRELPRLRREETQSKEEWEKSSAKAQKLREQAEKKREEEGQLSALSRRLPEMLERLSQLREGAKGTARLESAQKEIQALLPEIQALEKQEASLIRQSSQAETSWKSALEHQRERLTHTLAATLEEGAPCPVCGSTRHPHLAPAPEGEMTESPQALSGKARELQEQRRKTSERLAGLRVSLETQQEAASQAKQAMEKTSYSPETLEKAQRICAAAREKSLQLEGLSLEIDSLSREREREEVSAKALESLYYEARSSRETAEARLEALRSPMASGISNSSELEKRISELSKNLDKEQARYQECSEKNKRISVLIAENAAGQRHSHTERDAAQAAFEDAKTLLHQALDDLGIASPEELEQNRVSLEERKAWEDDLSRYEQKSAALAQRKEELLAALQKEDEMHLSMGDQPQKDHAKLLDSISIREKEIQKKAEEAAVLQSEQKRLSQIARRMEKEQAKALLQREEAARRMEFARLLRGERGISFTRYVLGVMLGLITQEANRLLRDVHGGMFQLHRRREPSDGRSKAGLELEAESAAGGRFSVRNLSGGEKFLLSLALSMALSAVLQQQAGGLCVEAMFIDEGFGSLDRQSLQEALGILKGICHSGRMVGVISHVPELRDSIPRRIDVSKDLSGSRLTLSL